MVDLIVLGFVAVAAVFGLIRGIVSQITSLAGIVCAYLIAPSAALKLGPWVQHQLGCSRFIAEKSSVFLVGVLIYMAFWLMGFGIEKLLVNRVKALWKLNRIGGATVGAAKAAVLALIVFCFLALLPVDLVRKTIPKILDSHVYQIAATYNPMGKQATIESMRRFRSTVINPAKATKLRTDPELLQLFKRHELSSALEDRRFVEAVRSGDYDQLRKVEKMEELMNDKELEGLLSKLESEKP